LQEKSPKIYRVGSKIPILSPRKIPIDRLLHLLQDSREKEKIPSMDPQKPRRSSGQRLLTAACLLALAGLALGAGGLYTVQGEWRPQPKTEKVPSGAIYRSPSIVVYVFRQEVWLARNPLNPWDTWEGCLHIRVTGATLGELHQADCELKPDKQLFVFTGNSAQSLIQAFQQGTGATIRDCMTGREFTVPLKGFNAAYEWVLKAEQ